MRVSVIALGGVVLWLAPQAIDAQQDRSQLIEMARAESDSSVRLTVYLEAANPLVRDSLWAVSVYDIAQMMLDQDQQPLAATWIRWAVRHGQWPIDSYFSPSLVRFYDSVAVGVAGDPGPEAGTVATEWRWPDDFGASQGALQVASSDPTVSLSVSVDGQDEVVPGQPFPLAPGTYELTATVDGYEEVRVSREVLPGVETIVSFDLVPVLPDRVAARVAQSVVPIRGAGGQAPVCTNGVPWQPGFVVTSLSALLGATDLSVQQGGLPVEAELVDADPGSDLAILRVQRDVGSPLSRGSIAGQRYAWSVFRNGCSEETEIVRSAITGPVLPQGGPEGASFPRGALGGPVVDREGTLVGLVAEGGISPIERADQIIAAAASQAEGGGFPTVWVALGAAAAGGVVALLLRGDDPSETGSIEIVIPIG